MKISTGVRCRACPLDVTVAGAVVSHTTKTLRVVALTSKAENIAAGEGVKKTLFVCAILLFIAPENIWVSMKVPEDNQGAMALVENPLSSARSKHTDVRYHFIREQKACRRTVPLHFGAVKVWQSHRKVRLG